MQYDYLKFFEDKLKELARTGCVLDIGGGKPFQKQMAKYQDLFLNVRYQTLDSCPDYNPTILGDAHNIPLKDNSIDSILCKSVLEHLNNPQKAVEEMYRVLKKKGKLLIYTHFIYPYHARKPSYLDYFRFSEDGLRELLKNFSYLEIKKQGGYFLALMFFLPFQKELRFILEPICYFLDKLFRTEKRTTTAGYYLYALK